jgi:co-chaperonin GroES (HSP10)
MENDLSGITTIDAEKPLTGTIRYGNDETLASGLNEGDVVVFEPHSEYEFRIEGEKLYRMYTKNLLIKLNEQDNGVKETND